MSNTPVVNYKHQQTQHNAVIPTLQNQAFITA